MENIELKRFWEKVKEELIGSLPESVHPWIYSLEVSGYDKGVLTVVTGQSIAKTWLSKNHSEQINGILSVITNIPDSRMNIIYDEASAVKLKKEVEKLQKKEAEMQQKELAMENLSYMQSSSNLNLKYKFENFVVGKSNKFAHDASLAVAKNPAEKYNPLFIYGSAGLGKTHLMQAIGHYILFNNSKLKVKYTKTDDYINDYISYSRKSNNTVENMSKFYKKYNNIDIILIDDIQVIESKIKSMERLQHTFDTLYNKGKQIVITSDRLPKEIPNLTKALCSRFEMGLMVELTPPELETRVGIMEKLAADSGIEYEKSALTYIAKHFTDNVRELEGAFTKVSAYAEISGEKLTLDLVKSVLKCDESKKSVDYVSITDVTAHYFGINVADIKGTARGQKVSEARQMAIYLCRELLGNSFNDIAEFFNKKYTTIMYAHDKVKKEIATNSNYLNAVREIKQALKVL
ncbi:chromosomal replication initiator protein DnaA [bacterium]|nr:chromosomal replication initiator protein DnaA [bacterium]